MTERVTATCPPAEAGALVAGATAAAEPAAAAESAAATAAGMLGATYGRSSGTTIRGSCASGGFNVGSTIAGAGASIVRSIAAISPTT